MAINIKKEFGNTRSRKPDISSLIYGKIPPQAPELEEAVIGGLLLGGNKIEDVMDILPLPDNFYVDANQKIYAAMIRLYQNGIPLDLLTMAEELRKTDELETVGGAYYLVRLTQNMVTNANIDHHAKIILEKFIQREMIRVCGNTISQAYEDSTDVFQLLNQMETDVADIFNKKTTDWKDMTQVGYELCKHIEDIQSGKVQYYTTGIDELDRVNGGFKGGDLVVLAARPSVGKSALMGLMALDNALRETPVALMPLEMSNVGVMSRMVALKARMQHWKIDRAKFYTNDEQQTVLQTISDMGSLPIFMSDASNITIHDISAKTAKLKRKHDIKILFIDYLQLVEANEKYGRNREQEVAELSRGLKLLAMRENIVVVILAQLNRESTKTGDKKPVLAHLRESGAIEQDADIVLLLHRDDMAGIPTNSDGSSTDGQADIIAAKWRNGATTSVKIGFDKEQMRFYNF